MKCRTNRQSVLPLLLLLALLIAPAAAQAPLPNAVWIYRDVPPAGKPDERTEAERMFAPFGYMPGSRTNQITVDQKMPVDEADESKGTCIEYYFEFKRPDDWVGAYTLVDGNAWGTKPGIDVQKLLGVKGDEQLVLRFQAKGEGVVSFKIGGVRDGTYKSSLLFARETAPGPVRLSATGFQQYSIGPIEARALTSLVDPFCVVASAQDNIGRSDVRVVVDDIRIERLAKEKKGASLPANWRERLERTLFVAYTPTGFDPTVTPVKQPGAADIRADLAAIRALGREAGIESVGIVSYGCRDGLETIAEFSREAGLVQILGIFNPRDEVELNNAVRILQDEKMRDTIVGCCVGNEAITFRRASWEDIERCANRLRRESSFPVAISTTEIVQSYGDKRLFSLDYALITAHGLFSEVYEPTKGADWVNNRIGDLIQAAPRNYPILLKEIGFPAGPSPHFDDEQQANYWRSVFSRPNSRKVNICIFDGLNNVPWKVEPVALPGGEKANIGPHWPVLFDADRKPKAFALELLALWKKSRTSK